MPSLSTIVAFAGASLLLLVIPGPALLYIVNRSVSDGRRAGLAAASGLALGNLVHAMAAAVGLSAVLATSASAFTAVKWLGASYLIWVGVRTLMRAPEAIDTSHDSVSPRRAFNQGVVVNVLNPKVALFFLSFLPQFIHSGHGRAAMQALTLGVVFVLLGLITTAVGSALFRNQELRGRYIQFAKQGTEQARIAEEPLLSLENGIKVRRKQNDALLDERFLQSKRDEEAKLRAAVAANPALSAELGDPWAMNAAANSAYRNLYLYYLHLESAAAFGGSQLFNHARRLVRAAAERAKPRT